MMELASIYEVSGRKADALALVNRVIALRRDVSSNSNNGNNSRNHNSNSGGGGSGGDTNPPDPDPDSHPQQPDPHADPMAFFPNQPAPRRTKRSRLGALTMEEWAEVNARKTEQTLVKYRKLDYLRAAMEAGDPDAVKDWLDTAGDLVGDFRNTRALFPSERSKAFKGFVSTAQRRAWAKGDKDRLERMQHRLEESLTYDDGHDDHDDPDLDPDNDRNRDRDRDRDHNHNHGSHSRSDTLGEDATTFRGLDFDTWLYIFMQYALCLAKHDNHLDAYDVCSVAKEANVSIWRSAGRSSSGPPGWHAPCVCVTQSRAPPSRAGS